jgi:hypothetical protein
MFQPKDKVKIIKQDSMSIGEIGYIKLIYPHDMSDVCYVYEVEFDNGRYGQFRDSEIEKIS